MKITVIISTMLISQVTASFFDVFQSAVSTVQNSVGKLFNDVVTDVKDTVDCTILAVEHALALRADADQLYYDKCGNGTKNNSSQPQLDEKHIPMVEISVTSNEEYLKKQVPDEIDARINDTLTKFINGYNSHEKLEEIKIELAKETQRLADVSEFVKMELDRSSNEIQFDASEVERNESKPSIDNILEQLKLLETVEKNLQNVHEANEVHKIIENVLHKLNSIESTEAAQNEKVEDILKEVENNSNTSYKDIRQQLHDLKEDEYRHLDLIQHKIDEHERSRDHLNCNENNHQNVMDNPPVATSTTLEPTFTTLVPTWLTSESTSTTQEPTSTNKPTFTTPQSKSTTPEPVATIPESTSTTPVPTWLTSEPMSPTPEPPSTTKKPMFTSAEPTSTPEPISTTPELTSITSIPTSTIPEPIYTTSEPTSTIRKPTTTTTEPPITTPEPISTKPEPTSTISEPKFTPPALTSTTSMPSSTTSIPTSTTPEFTSTKLEFTSTTPEFPSTTPEFTSTTPEFTSTTPEFTSITPEFTSTTPEFTSTTPEFTSTTPEFTSTQPECTPTAPEFTSTSPVATSTSPVATSTTPVLSWPTPKFTFSTPLATSSTPVPSSFTSETTSYTLEPTSTTPEPMSNTPEPTSITSISTSTTPEPLSTTPEPTSTTNKPTFTTSQSKSTRPEPVATIPESTSTTPVPTWCTSEPMSSTPEPPSTTKKPMFTSAEPTSTTQEPLSTTPELTPTTSIPTSTTPEPTSTIREPTTTTAETSLPTITTPELISTKREPTSTISEPQFTTLSPTSTTLMPTSSTPEFTSTSPVATSTTPVSRWPTQEFTSTRPVATFTTPVSTWPTPEPTSTIPEPMSATPGPTSYVSETTSSTLEPTSTTLEPIFTAVAFTSTTSINISESSAEPQYELLTSNVKGTGDIKDDKELIRVDTTTNNTSTPVGTVISVESTFSVTDQPNTNSEKFASSALLASSSDSVKSTSFSVVPKGNDDIFTAEDTSCFLAIDEFPSVSGIEKLSSTAQPETTQGYLELSTLSRRSKDYMIAPLISIATTSNFAIPTTRLNAVMASLPLEEFRSVSKILNQQTIIMQTNADLQTTTPVIITTQAYENTNRPVDETTDLLNIYSSTIASKPVITTLLTSLPHKTNQEFSNDIIKETLKTTELGVTETTAAPITYTGVFPLKSLEILPNVPTARQADLRNFDTEVEESTEYVSLENTSDNSNSDYPSARITPFFSTDKTTTYTSTTPLIISQLLPTHLTGLLSSHDHNFSDDTNVVSATIKSNEYEYNIYSTTAEPSHSTTSYSFDPTPSKDYLMITSPQYPIIKTTEVTTECLEYEETTDTQENFEDDYENESSMEDLDFLELENSEILESSNKDDHPDEWRTTNDSTFMPPDLMHSQPQPHSATTTLNTDLQAPSTLLPPDNIRSAFRTNISNEVFAYTQSKTVKEPLHENMFSTISTKSDSPTFIPPNKKYTEKPPYDSSSLALPPVNRNVELPPPPETKKFNDNPPTVTPFINFLRHTDRPSLNTNLKSTDFTTPAQISTLKTKDFDNLDSDSIFHNPAINSDEHVKALKEAQQLIAESQQQLRVFESIRNSTGLSLFG